MNSSDETSIFRFWVLALRPKLIAGIYTLFFLLCVLPAAAEDVAWGKNKDGLIAGLIVENSSVKIGQRVKAIFIVKNDSETFKKIPKPLPGTIDWEFRNPKNQPTASIRSEPSEEAAVEISLAPGRDIRSEDFLVLDENFYAAGHKNLNIRATFYPIDLSSGFVKIVIE